MVGDELPGQQGVPGFDMLHIHLGTFLEILGQKPRIYKRVCIRPVGKGDKLLLFVPAALILQKLVAHLTEHCLKRCRLR